MMEKIKWGILGGGDIVKDVTANAIQQSKNGILYAIASQSNRNHDFFMKKFKPCVIYEDYNELLSNPHIDAVYIALPNALHYEWTIKALNMNKHVLTEKPISTNEANVIEMFRIASIKDRYLMEGFAFLHSPIMFKIKELIINGVIGQIQFIDAFFYSPGYPESSPTIRRHTYGGSVYDIGCYNIAMLYYLLEKEPDYISGSGEFSYLNTDYFSSFFLKYGEVSANVRTYIGTSYRNDGFSIYGNKGILIVPLEYNFAGKGNIYLKTDSEIKEITVESPDNYQLEFEHFVDCIVNQKECRIGEDFSIRQARTLDRMLNLIGY